MGATATAGALSGPRLRDTRRTPRPGVFFWTCSGGLQRRNHGGGCSRRVKVEEVGEGCWWSFY